MSLQKIIAAFVLGTSIGIGTISYNSNIKILKISGILFAVLGGWLYNGISSNDWYSLNSLIISIMTPLFVFISAKLIKKEEEKNKYELNNNPNH
jgi:hypothetical protein